MVINIISFCLISFLFGMIFYKKVNNYFIKQDINKKKSEIESIFNLVLDSIKNGNSKFKSRFLKTAYITTNTSKTGVVDIIYLLDRGDIAILKDNQVKYVSDGVNRSIINETISYININHGDEINDVVNLFGLIFSKKDFESNFNMKVEDLNKIINSEVDSEINIIVKNNKKSFDIDEILDKISKSGIYSLTIEEKKYLNDYSNGRRD
jgi:hypothetical protein